jgi:isocitrate/isopropylmalate dehydrogenase
MAGLLMNAITSVVAERRVKTPDMGGTSTTSEVVDEICARLDMTST